MRFTAQEKYGLRCMVQLAKHEDVGSITIEEIARSEGLTPHYIGKLMRILLKGGLIVSIRGQKGGYKLARPAAQISISEILVMLDGPLFKYGHCEKFTDMNITCVHSTECSVRALWSTLDRAVSRILDNTMLKDLIVSEKDATEWFRYGSKASNNAIIHLEDID